MVHIAVAVPPWACIGKEKSVDPFSSFIQAKQENLDGGLGTRNFLTVRLFEKKNGPINYFHIIRVLNIKRYVVELESNLLTKLISKVL